MLHGHTVNYCPSVLIPQTMSFVNIKKTSSILRPPLDSSTNSRFLKEFVDIELISKGAFGHVYRAQKKWEKRYFAVKCIQFIDNDEEIKQFSMREVEVIYA